MLHQFLFFSDTHRLPLHKNWARGCTTKVYTTTATSVNYALSQLENVWMEQKGSPFGVLQIILSIHGSLFFSCQVHGPILQKSFVPGAHLWRFLSGCTVSGQAIAVKPGRTSLLWCEDAEYVTGCQEAQSWLLWSHFYHDFLQKWREVIAVSGVLSVL